MYAKFPFWDLKLYQWIVTDMITNFLCNQIRHLAAKHYICMCIRTSIVSQCHTMA